jgi:hypothetical protein
MLMHLAIARYSAALLVASWCNLGNRRVPDRSRFRTSLGLVLLAGVLAFAGLLLSAG